MTNIILSFRNTLKFYENVDLPVYSKHLTLASYAHARRGNYKDYLDGRKKVIESGEKGADHGTLMGFESEGIWNEIASKIADLGLGWFFGMNNRTVKHRMRR